MKKVKNLNFSYLSLGILFLIICFISLLNFIDVFSSKFANVLIYIAFFITIILNSFKISLKSKDKGIISGLKVASFIFSIIILMKLILKIKFNWGNIIYISLIYLFSIISAIYGANKKSSRN